MTTYIATVGEDNARRLAALDGFDSTIADLGDGRIRLSGDAYETLAT